MGVFDKAMRNLQEAKKQESQKINKIAKKLNESKIIKEAFDKSQIQANLKGMTLEKAINYLSLQTAKEMIYNKTSDNAFDTKVMYKIFSSDDNYVQVIVDNYGEGIITDVPEVHLVDPMDESKEIKEEVEIEVPEEVAEETGAEIVEESLEEDCDELDEKKSKGRYIEIDESLLTEGGIYPVNLETEDATEALEEKIQEVLGEPVKVTNLEVIPSIGWVGDRHYYKADIGIGDLDIIKKFLGEDTPTLNQMVKDDRLIINMYSDIEVKYSYDVEGYESGLTIDWTIDEDYPVDEEKAEAEADIVSNKIIKVLMEHEEEFVEMLKDYEIFDDEYEDYDEDEDFGESKKLTEEVGDSGFTLRINTGSAAFEEDEESTLVEVARILSDIVDNLEYTDNKSIMDVNGNKVGSYGFSFEGVTEKKACNESLEIDDKSFNRMLTKFVIENYKNADRLRLAKVTEGKDTLKLECNLKTKNNKITPVVLEAKGKISGGRSILKVYENKIFKHENAEKHIMTMIVSNSDNTIKLEKLKYNFNTRLDENKKAVVSGIING